ncbi:cytochrome P450 [Streptacidiphilus sp. MAP5-52]|uniref:cytochrome P450 family protein n=1 Tax=Streptacidiphilus sp. MAP5-52 TaxID=3156267 RepID=UPI003512919D
MTQHHRELPEPADRPPSVQQIGDPGRASYLVTGYAEAREALLDPTLSKNTGVFFAGQPSTRDVHPAISRSMLATDPPEHTRLRRLVVGAFSTGTVQTLRPRIEQLTLELLDRFPEGQPVDLVRELAVPLPVAVICEMLDVPAADRAYLAGLSAQLFASGRPEVNDRASHELAGYMDALVEGRRARLGDDLLSRLIQAQDGDGQQLSHFELTSLACLLLVAGHETTTHAIGNALLELLQRPDVLTRLRANASQIPEAVDELLRLGSPVALTTFRWSTEPIVLGGQDIPAGRPVLVALGAANRDQAAYPDPDRLDLDRGAQAHLAFGHGIHRCLGAPLARAEVEIVLAELITRFTDLRLAVEPADLHWQKTRLVRGLVSLPVLLGARAHPIG